MNSFRCYICDDETQFYCSDIHTLKSKYSETLVISFLEEFLDQEIKIEDDDFICKTICQDCLLKIDEYDQASLTIKRIKEQFRTMLLKERWDSTLGDIIVEKLESDDDDDKHYEEEIVNVKIEEVKEEDIQGDDDEIGDIIVKEIILEKDNELKGYISCKECNEIVDSVAELRKHKREHTKAKKSIKKETNYFASYDDMITTTNTISQVTKVPRKYTKGQGTKKSTVVIIPNIKCSECTEVFSTRTELTTHRKVHDSRCPHCEGQYRDADELEAHIEKHELFKPLQCVECGKQFAKRNNLARHMPIHTGEKVFQCEQCGKEYIHHSSFRMHKLAHKNIREKSCTTCGLTFRSSSHLTRHSRIHTGAKPYECPICKQKFAQRYNMLSHSKIHSNEGKVVKKTHICVICNAAYAKPLYLKEHMKRIHCDTVEANPCEVKEEIVDRDLNIIAISQ